MTANVHANRLKLFKEVSGDINNRKSTDAQIAHEGEPDDGELDGLNINNQVLLDDMNRLSLNDKDYDLPRQLPALDASPLNFDLLSKDTNGGSSHVGTPKFNDQEQLKASDSDYYLKKR